MPGWRRSEGKGARPVQATEPLPQRVERGDFRHQTVEVDIDAGLDRLGGDHHQRLVETTRCVRVAGGTDRRQLLPPGFSVDPAGRTDDQGDIGFRKLASETVEHTARPCHTVQHDADGGVGMDCLSELRIVFDCSVI